LCQSASRAKLILGLSSTSKVEDLWTTRLGTAYCQCFPFSLIVVALGAMYNSSHLSHPIYLDQLEAADEQDQVVIDPSAVAAALEKLKSDPEPEAQFMRTRDGIAPAYNVQTAVDAEHGIIVAQQVTTEATDNLRVHLWKCRRCCGKVGMTRDSQIVAICRRRKAHWRS